MHTSPKTQHVILLGLLLWLLPALALAQADACFQNEFSALPTTDCGNNVCQSEVSTYYNYLNTNPHVVDAMDWCTGDGSTVNPERPQALRDAIWEKFEYAQANPSTGTVAVADTVDYNTGNSLTNRYTTYLAIGKTSAEITELYGVRNLGMTLAELIDAYSAKVAHMVWVDVADHFPWKLSDYSEQEVRYLIDPEELWQTAADGYRYGTGGEGYASFTTPLAGDPDYVGAYARMKAASDRSPADVWAYIEPLVSGVNSPRTAFNRLSEPVDLSHHVGDADPRTPLTFKDWVSVANQKSSMYPEDTTSTTFLARSGCNDRGQIFMAALRAANIPVYYVDGKVGSSGHSAAVIPTLNVAYWHADWVAQGGYALFSSAYPYQERLSVWSGSRSCAERWLVPMVNDSFAAAQAAAWRMFHVMPIEFWYMNAKEVDFCVLGFDEYFWPTWGEGYIRSCEATTFKPSLKANLASIHGCSGDLP